jgi:hypothetical protein
LLLLYSVHFKSNRGEATSNIGKREEAARQLLGHVSEMERAYSGSAKVVTVLAGDFNTDPTDARFASEGTFVLLREKFILGVGKYPAIGTRDKPGKWPLPGRVHRWLSSSGSENLLLQAHPYFRSQ